MAAVVLVCAGIEALTTAADKLRDSEAQEAAGYLREALDQMTELLEIADPALVNQADIDYVSAIAYAALTEQVMELKED